MAKKAKQNKISEEIANPTVSRTDADAARKNNDAEKQGKRNK